MQRSRDKSLVQCVLLRTGSGVWNPENCSAARVAGHELSLQRHLATVTLRPLAWVREQHAHTHAHTHTHTHRALAWELTSGKDGDRPHTANKTRRSRARGLSRGTRPAGERPAERTERE